MQGEKEQIRPPAKWDSRKEGKTQNQALFIFFFKFSQMPIVLLLYRQSENNLQENPDEVTMQV